MGRLQKIEDLVAGSLAEYNNLKIVVRGRPRYLDPQLDIGKLRFATKRGANFTALLADNQTSLAVTAQKGGRQVQVTSRPHWFTLNSLIRVGFDEDIGEAHLIRDLLDNDKIGVFEPLQQDYVISDDTPVPTVSLMGSPIEVFAVPVPPFNQTTILIESQYQIFPEDVVLLSPDPTILESLAEYRVASANLIQTLTGPPIKYRYELTIGTETGLLPFTPLVEDTFYLRAQPLYYREGFGTADISIPPETGPFLFDALYGPLLINRDIITKIGLQTFDGFGNQLNVTPSAQWQIIPHNYLVLERPIPAESFLFWQRIRGFFQYSKLGFFITELDDSGEFIMSSDLLVPEWPSDIQRGWVVSVIAQAPCTITVQFEPQAPVTFDIAANTTIFFRPKILADPKQAPVTRILFAVKGSPSSTVQMNSWQFDGSTVESFSYFLMGTEAAYGQERWLAGGFNLKPFFLNLSLLRGRYSDGNTIYNGGYIYS